MPRSIDSLRPKKDSDKLQRGSVPTTVVRPTVATNTDSGATETPANIMKRKTPRFTLKTKILSAFVLVLVAVVAFVGYNYFVNRDAVARIKGKTISKQQFEDAKKAYGKLATNRDGSKSGTDVEKYAREQLLIEQAMLADMERNKLSLKDSDIVKELQKNPDSLKGSNDAETIRLNIEAIKAIYGFSDDATALRAIRMRAMQDLLAGKVLSYRDVLHVITRWDISAVNGVTWSEVEADRLAKGALEQRILPLMQRNASDEEIINVATSGRDLEDSNALSPSAVIPIKMTNLNRAANPGEFQDQSEWNEIERLTKVGEFTPVTKSAAGYYYIDRLTAIGTGTFASWDEYNAQVLKDANLFNDGWDVRKLTSVITQNHLADAGSYLCPVASEDDSVFRKIARTILGVQNASACSVTATDRHTVTFSGRVMKSSGDPWSGVTVLVTPRAGQERCGNASADGIFLTDGAGYWSSGSWSANALSDRTASLTGQAFSCYIKWRAIVTVPGGCQKDVDLIMPSGANGSNQGNKNIYIDCAPILKGTIKITHILHNRDGSVVEGRVPTDKRLVDCVSSASIAGPGNPFGFTFICLDNDTQSSAEWLDQINAGGYYLALISNVGGTVSPMDLNDNWSFLKMEATYSHLAPGTVFDISAEPHNFYVGPNITTNITVHFKDNRPEEPPRVNFTGRKINEAGAVGSPYGEAQVCIDSTACDTANPYAINSILANQGHTLTSANVTGFDLVGYKESGGPLIPSSTYQYYAGQAGNNETITVDWVYRPKITGSITSTCSLITTSTSAPSGVTFDLTIDGVSLGNSSSITVPDDYKDGVTRTLRLTATYAGTTYELDTKTHVCQYSARCVDDSNLSAVLGSGVDTAGTITVKVTMGNDGGAIWKPAGTDQGHRLVLTGDTEQFWTSPSTQKVAGGSLGVGAVGPAQNHEFTVSLQPQAVIGSAPDVPLKLRMAYVNPSDDSIAEFGEVCETTVTLRSFYGPWLRVQNGSTTSLNTIAGQDANIIGQPAGARGIRKSDDPNYDTTFLVMAVAGGRDFCSSNGYVFGQGDTNSSCVTSFDGYSTALGVAQTNLYWDKVSDFTNSDPQCLDPTSPSAARRTKVLGRGSINAVFNSTGDLRDTTNVTTQKCDVIYSINNPGGGTLTSGGPGGWQVNKGKASILHTGSLEIKSDIKLASPSGTLDYANDLVGLTDTFPSLGIIVQGDVYIDSTVTDLDVVIFATGKIFTCSEYTNGTTTGVKRAADALKCSKKLTVRGGLYALGGYQFGRNFFEHHQPKDVNDDEFDFQPADGYWGEPAEDIIGNGVSLITTPPGFDLLPNGNASSLTYLQGNFTPRF